VPLPVRRIRRIRICGFTGTLPRFVIILCAPGYNVTLVADEPGNDGTQGDLRRFDIGVPLVLQGRPDMLEELTRLYGDGAATFGFLDRGYR